MNRNGASINEKEAVVNIGLHIEAIDDEGNWCESEIINIVDSKIILKFLKHKEPCNRLFDISSDKWRFISKSQNLSNFSVKASHEEYKKGDYVLVKWHDGNYYLSEILDITTKTKFGTKVKEYHIVYLYDNVEETVSYNRLKLQSHNNIDNNYSLNIDSNMKSTQPTITSNNNSVNKRSYRKRGIAENLESQKSNDNVFYDEKTKRFTESCKIRRLRLSQTSEKEKNSQEYEAKDSNFKLEKTEELIEDKSKSNRNTVNHNLSNSQPSPIPLNHSKQRFSQRKRRSSFRKADYFYPDSVDHHSLNDRNKMSNNVSQISTPVIHESFEDGAVSKSPRTLNSANNSNNNTNNNLFSSSSSNHQIMVLLPQQKDCTQSSNYSPISVSLTSAEASPKLKPKLECLQSELEIKYDNDEQVMYSCNDEGQYLCVICTNKTFRKKKLVMEHIKYYHSKECHPINNNMIQPIPKARYSPNKRYYSSYLKNNRSSLERKKHFSKLKKTYINRTLWSSRNNVSEKSPEFANTYQNFCQIPQTDHSAESTTHEPSDPMYPLPSVTRKPSSSIVYCHRCKKSTEDGCLVQCDVCLCWSHTVCYGLSENKDNSNFWECDNCANAPTSTLGDGRKTLEWHRDRWRFHSVLHNELPWMSKPVSSKSSNSLKNICEMQSLLSLSQRVLEAITRNLDKLIFKGPNDSNSQDDLDILKNLCAYDSIDEIPRLESLDVLNLNIDQEELFKVSGIGNHPAGINCISNNKQSNPSVPLLTHSNFHFNEISFSNSTPIKAPVNGHKSINNSLDGILDCDIQKLEIIPKADFDALVKDLNSCEDIYKKNNGEHHSKVSILDFIDDNCSMSHADRNVTNTNLDTEMPFSQSQCLYQNADIIIEQPEPIIYLSNDELTNLLMEKESQKDMLPCEEDICSPDRHISSAEKYESRNLLLPSSSSDFQTRKTTGLSAEINSFDKIDFHTSKITEDKPNPPDSKLEIEFNYLNAIIQPEGSNIGPGTSTAFVESEMRLNSSDSKCLHWLIGKFSCVEKIVESVESTLLSSYSSSLDPSSSLQMESDHSRISKYLQSLLYILKKNQGP